MKLKIKHKFTFKLVIDLKEIGYNLGLIEKPLSRKCLDFFKKIF